MKGKLYLLSALLLLYSPIFAQQVSLETAQRVANMFLQNNVPAAMRSASATNTTTSSASVIKPIGKVAQSPVMYAVSQDSVWVLVSADERVTPILAYSDANAGMFPEEEDMPDGMIALLEWYEQQIQYLRDSTNITTIHEGWQTYQATSTTTEYEIIVSPLLYRDGVENLWKQSGLNSGIATADKCYNKFCPLYHDGRKTIVGCVAVAMGQLMWYWEWPKIAVVEDDERNTLIREYNWDYMPAQLHSNTSIEHIDMVANLLHDAGVSVNMSYGPSGEGGSGAVPELIPDALRGTFSYNSDELIKRNKYASSWLNKLKENLDRGYPILYGGRDSANNGHRFIVDGYNSNDAFHINYGWGGSHNGYYILETIVNKPFIYYSSQSAVLNVYPNYPDCSPREVSQSEMLDSKFAIQNGGGLTIGGDIVVESNQGGVIYSGEYVKLTNGFHAKVGSNLRIAIKNIQCNESQSASLVQQKSASKNIVGDWCNQWNILSYGQESDSNDPFPSAQTNIFWLSNNTINRNGYEYFSLLCSSSKPDIESAHLVGELRFTEDKQVYFYYDNTEYLLYDFGAQVGDQLQIFSGIDNYDYPDYYRTYTHVVTKREYLDDGRVKLTSIPFFDIPIPDIIDENNYPSVIWIEGVGSEHGIIHNNINNLPGSGTDWLLCAYHNDECRYITDNPEYAPLGCIYNEGDVINAVEHISVSAPSVQKIIKDGQLLILRDGKTYNVMGVEVGE